MASLADLWKSCVNDSQASDNWERLLEGYGSLFSRIVVRVARRFGITEISEIDDAVQEICLKISSQACSKLVPQSDDALLEAYLKASIANAAHDYFRSLRAKRRDFAAATSIDEVPQSSLRSVDHDPDRELLIREIERLVEGSARDRNIFLLYYRHGWTAKEISAIPSLGLTAKGVESLILRMVTAIRTRIRGPQDREIGKGFSQPNA